VINDEDTESAYNLGIAYKEMGLLDDAIVEFDKAMASSTRMLDCVCLKAACYIAQQKFTAAEEVLTKALSGSLNLEQKILLYYETGLLYEAWDRGAAALASYQVVAASDPHFRDVSNKIVELKGMTDSENGDALSSSRVSYL
jgi:tetratricopeptide (TPR) repeat protein